MRVCTECGRENIAHLPRRVNGYIPCSCQYEDIIASLKQQLKNCIHPTEYQAMLEAAQVRNATINRRNQQIKDLKRHLDSK